MVSALNRNAGVYDFRLTHSASGSAVQQGFICVSDPESGLLAYQQGVAPYLTPQVRTSSVTSAHIDPAIQLVYAVRDLSGGAGLREADGSISAHLRRYNYARHVDCSWPNVILRAPQEQATAAFPNAGTIVQFLRSQELGFYAADGRYIYEWTSGTTWTQRNDEASDVGQSQLFEYSNSTDTYLLSAGSTNSRYNYSTDGTTWTERDATTYGFGAAVKFFAVWHTASSEPQLVGITEAGDLRTTTNPINGGAWTAGDQIGLPHEVVTGLVVVNDTIYVLKETAIWSYDGTTVGLVWSARDLKKTGNGSKHIVWSDNNVYAFYGNSMLKFDPVANTISRVYPLDDSLGNAEINGDVKGITATASHIYFSIVNNTPDSYVIKGNPSTGEWHTWAFNSSANFGALLALEAGNTDGDTGFHANNPAILFADDTNDDAGFFILPRDGYTPADDGNCRFSTTIAAILQGPMYDFGLPATSKIATRGDVDVQDSTSAGLVVLRFVQPDATLTTVVTTTQGESGLFSGTLTSAVEDTRFAFRLVPQAAASATEAISVRGFSLRVSANPPRLRTWQMDVLLGAAQRGGGQSRYSPAEQEAFLFNALEELCTLGARNGTTYSVRVLDLEYAGVRQYQGRDHPVVRISMVQI